MATRPRKNSSKAGSARPECTDTDGGRHSWFLNVDDTFEYPGPRGIFPLASADSATGGSYLLFIFTSIVLSPVHYVRHIYRYGSRYATTGGRRRLRRALDSVFERISGGDYQTIPMSEKGNARRASSRCILILCTLTFVFVVYRICGGIMFHGQPTYYIQGQTYPVDTSHPGHYMIHHMEGMNSDLELTPYRQGQADIFRINFTHLNEPPVPLYRYISTLKGGYDGETFIYESVPLNNTRVVFKQFFTTTRSQPVPRDARSKMLSEARALNRIITGESDWTSGMSELVEEHNLWGWPSSGTDGKVPKHDKPWRHYRMDWPVEVAASMRRWAPFREVIERLGEEMNCTEIGRPKKIERWSIEEEQEEGELIRVLDVFYLPDFEIMEVDVGDKPKKERLAENQKQKRPQPKQQTAEDFAKETSMESVALKEAGLIKEMSEDLAERREMNGNRDTIPTRQKKILRNLSTDIESWGMVLPLLEGGDADHLVGVLPMLGLSPADLDWLYRPLFAHGVLKALSRMHHTREDQYDRNQLRWRLTRGKWYSELGTSEFTDNDNSERIGTHGIPRARRPQRIADNTQGYCHGDVKLDNIFIRRATAEKRPTIETTISDGDAAPHQFRKPEDYLAIMKTEKAHPTLEPPRGPRHYLVLSGLSQTRPLHHARHIRNNWRDCRLADMDRAWRSYLHLLRMGSRTRRDRNGGESTTRPFDKVFLKYRSAFISSNGLLLESTNPPESEEYASAYFAWLASPQIPSLFFLSAQGTSSQKIAGGFWTSELPPTRMISIMGSPAREMSRSQVFAVVDGLRGEIDLIKEKGKGGKPVSIPSWYYEFGMMRPGLGGEETEEERLVGMATQVLGSGVKVMGM